MAVTVRLLGPPQVERDGVAAPPPRGRKAWALLAYLVLTRRPSARAHLAELLFADADDPLGALRWTLAELRRALGDAGLFRGDPLSPGTGDVRVDVDRAFQPLHPSFERTDPGDELAHRHQVVTRLWGRDVGLFQGEAGHLVVFPEAA